MRCGNQLEGAGNIEAVVAGKMSIYSIINSL